MAAAPTPSRTTPRPRVLVGDDDADMLRLLSLPLQAAGYVVVAVGAAEAALAQLDMARPQLVLRDVRLPGRDGLALFDEVRARPPSLPVTLLTAHGTIPDAVEATSRGVFTYLTKPYDGKELLEKIVQALALSAPAVTHAHAHEAWRADIVSRSNRMTDLLAEAYMVAQSDASVLLLGDSGSGKELLAQAIHRASPAGHAAAGAAGTRGAPRGCQPVDSHRRAHHLGHAPRPGSRHGHGPVPRRPVLPAQCGHAGAAHPGRSARRHRAAGQPLSRQAGAQVRQAPVRLCTRGAQGTDPGRLAWQRATALQRRRTGVCPVHHAPGAPDAGAARAAHAIYPGAELC